MRCVLLSLLATSLAQAGDLRVGAAAADITPPRGMPMAGYYSARGAEGTHDPLHAKVIVLEKDGVKAALVGLDLLATTPDLVARTRKEIERTTDIPGANVMLSATHSHTGPTLWVQGAFVDLLGGDVDAARKYLDGLPARIAEGVKQANDKLAPAKALQGIGREEGLTFNRRFHMRDGTVGWNPGKLNKEIVRPAGPTDPAVPVVHFEGPDGKAVATYVNFAMHLDTVGGREFSADYAYTLSKSLAAAQGEGLVTLFTVGTCGDLNHIDVSDAKPQKGHAEAARIGTVLAANVLRGAKARQAVDDGPLRVSRKTVSLALPEVTPAQVTEAKEVVAQLREGKKPPPFLAQVQAFKALDVAERLGKPWEVEVQVVALGDVAWVSLPGEIFVELGLAIKHHSPFRQTIVAELANGSVGYIPTRTAYPEGNYEVLSARVAEGSGEKLVDAALEQLRALHRAGLPMKSKE